MASTLSARSGFSREPGLAKNFPPKIPRNPLISLDSDERIQGNPRESNSQSARVSRDKGDEARKSKSSLDER